jgi:hypothetical protein
VRGDDPHAIAEVHRGVIDEARMVGVVVQNSRSPGLASAKGM